MTVPAIRVKSVAGSMRSCAARVTSVSGNDVPQLPRGFHQRSPGHDQLFWVPAEAIDVRGCPLDRGDGVFNPCRVGFFGCEPVIHLHDVRAGAGSDTARPSRL